MITRACAVLVVCLLTVSACASRAPVSLSQDGVRVWQADKAVSALGVMQSAAIDLNGIERCDTTGSCVPLLSDGDTATVVEVVGGAVRVIEQVPQGWRAASLLAVDQVGMALSAAGNSELAIYIQTAGSVISAIPE